MLPLAHAGLTTPAVAGPGCNEGLGHTHGNRLASYLSVDLSDHSGAEGNNRECLAVA